MKRKHAKHQSPEPFPIVGIGASAGGLEAFRQLLPALPSDTGMAFVLVQHLDPHHESALTQILARTTSLPVHEIVEDQPVRPNEVYVIPRDSNLTIQGGILKLDPRPRTRAPHRPIDIFFESLAQDKRAQAIGVVLSGIANDGTLGLEAIKAEGGITFAQDDTAKHDSMPRSAVEAGVVDLVLSPARIAEELGRIARHPYGSGRPLELPGFKREDNAKEAATPVLSEAGADGGYQTLMRLLRNHSGVDFSLYKSSTIQRRIARRMILTKHDAIAEYADFLRGKPDELEALYSDVLISVTSFFRNPEVFDLLQREVLPRLLEERPGEPVRVWVLGCSTGQEAYSIAMAFVEASDNAPRLRKLQVFATDLNEYLLEKARHGLYSKSLANDVTPERLRRFFVEEEGGYRVKKMLREMVIFARQNLISDPPFSRMDLISCRNLLIYLEPPLQRKILPTFHYALRPGGVLILGASESIAGFADLFEPLDKKHKIYVRTPVMTPNIHLPLRPAHGDQSRRLPRATVEQPLIETEPSAQREADRITLSQFAPPGVLVNDSFQVLQFRGATGEYLEPSPGSASFDLLKMARQGLMLPLRATLNEARKSGKAVRRTGVGVKRDGKLHRLDLKVVPLTAQRERYFLVLFENDAAKDTTEPVPEETVAPSGDGAQSDRVAELETELSETREYVQAIQEQHAAANEELQAANEEVQSSNEELQSINEELETSKEELESANEELTTVNDEISNRNIELTQLTEDLSNLQNSARLAIIVLDRDLTLRRFSPQAAKQLDLLNSDLGRPVSRLRHNLTLSSRDDGEHALLDLEQIARDVIVSLREAECDVCDRSGRWHLLRVRPYMTHENRVDGAVIVLFDIHAIRHALEYTTSIIRTVHEPLLVLDQELRVRMASESFYENYGVSPAETENRLLYELGNGQWDIPALRHLLEEILPYDTRIADYEVEHVFEHIGRRTISLYARRFEPPGEGASTILLTLEDVTERKRVEQELQQSHAELQARIEELTRFNRAAVGLDPRMSELKKKLEPEESE